MNFSLVFRPVLSADAVEVPTKILIAVFIFSTIVFILGGILAYQADRSNDNGDNLFLISFMALIVMFLDFVTLVIRILLKFW